MLDCSPWIELAEYSAFPVVPGGTSTGASYISCIPWNPLLAPQAMHQQEHSVNGNETNEPGANLSDGVAKADTTVTGYGVADDHFSMF